MSAPLDPFDDVMGVGVPSDRLAEILEAYRDVLAEIQKLRALDLTDVHPAVVFDPSIPYRQSGEPRA